MLISDWSSDVCSSDLRRRAVKAIGVAVGTALGPVGIGFGTVEDDGGSPVGGGGEAGEAFMGNFGAFNAERPVVHRMSSFDFDGKRSEELRVGKECVSPGRYRCQPCTKKKKKKK